MKTLDWKEKGININLRNMSYLRFADDLILVAESAVELQIMLAQLHEASLSIGIGMNMLKTKRSASDTVSRGSHCDSIRAVSSGLTGDDYRWHRTNSTEPSRVYLYRSVRARHTLLNLIIVFTHAY
ncbi:unnamed protein product [Arctia plantaginis]|uniref:Reverse transcriptase domain-containing protein n=1 Tax=Arctia plantaginis TaxID=874455 RepID=A0A8S0YYE9_ARCPL|nr:unnamed protein product [Arctia plantaginis]